MYYDRHVKIGILNRKEIMKIVDSRGLKLLYKSKRLKKLSLRFAKLLKKKYPYLEIYIDYLEEEGVKLPIFVIGVPDDLNVQNEQKFLENLGELLEQAGNLSELADLFLLTMNKISVMEEKLDNANI